MPDRLVRVGAGDNGAEGAAARCRAVVTISRRGLAGAPPTAYRQAMSSRQAAILVCVAGLSGCIGELTGWIPGEANQGGGAGVTGGGGGVSGQGGGEAPVVCDVPSPLPGATVPMRRLNREHVLFTVRDVLGVSEPLAVSDEHVFTYRSNISATVDDNGAQAYLDFAERVSTSPELSLTGCTASACLSWLLDEVGLRLFRRPLEAEARARYTALYQAGVAQAGAGDAGAREGARWVLQAFLQSPSFLYVDEPLVDGRLDGYGVATRLALSLWSSNPDVALLEAAAAGELDTADGIRQRVHLMLNDARSERGFTAFVSQWLELERMRRPDARPDVVALGEPLIRELEQEPVLLVRRAVLEGASLEQLLTTSQTVTLPLLRAHYGADVLSVEGATTSLDPERRAGVLTLAGVMTAMSNAGITSPSVRGHALLTNVMCTPPPPPPDGVSLTLPPPQPGATTRQRMEAHFSDPSCGGCHRVMDGVGFSFEHIDPVGRWRLLDNGQPIDDAVEIPFGQERIPVHGPRALATLFSTRPEVHSCFARQWTRYALGALESAEVKCFPVELGRQVNQPGGLEALISELAASDYFRKGAP